MTGSLRSILDYPAGMKNGSPMILFAVRALLAISIADVYTFVIFLKPNSRE
jgi:hypothetical protein